MGSFPVMGVYHSAYYQRKPVQNRPSEYLRDCNQLTLGDAFIKLYVVTVWGKF